MTDDDAPRPRMIPGLSHRYGDALTVEQLRDREAADREREAARTPQPPKPLGELVTVGGKPPPPYRPAAPPVAAPKPQPPRVSDEGPKHDRAMSKLFTTTERLSADERSLIRELRAVGPETAGRSVTAIREAKRGRVRPVALDDEEQKIIQGYRISKRDLGEHYPKPTERDPR